jgi:hypothetical protein
MLNGARQVTFPKHLYITSAVSFHGWVAELGFNASER